MYAFDVHMVGQPVPDAIEDETRQILPARHELAVGKLGDIDVDVAVIEPVLHFVGENCVQLTQVYDESG